MYVGVPMATPVAVSRESAPPVLLTARAIPKSVTMARPPSSDSRMLSGLMSRWITPRECAYASAFADFGQQPPRVRHGHRAARPPSDARASRLATYAMTKNTRPPRSSTVKIGTMLGCESCAAVSASRRNRDRMSARNDSSGGRHLDGDGPLEPAVARQIHDPHAAASDLTVELERRRQHLLDAREKLSVGGRRHRIGHSQTLTPHYEGLQPAVSNAVTPARASCPAVLAVLRVSRRRIRVAIPAAMA